MPLTLAKTWSGFNVAFPHAPEYVQLYPTIRCNQNCSFCFNSSTLKRGTAVERGSGKINKNIADLSYDNALYLLDIFSKNGIWQIDVMGGEPLLLPWIRDFVEIAVLRKFKVNISTNGSLPSVIERFRVKEKDNLTIGVSLEGSTKERHNSLTNSSHFHNALESIETLVALDFRPVVKTVIMRSSLDDIQAIVNILRRIGVRGYYMLHMDFLTKQKSLMEEALCYTDFLNFFEDIRRGNRNMAIYKVHASCFDRTSIASGVRCAGAVRKLSLLPDGSVFPCNLIQNTGKFLLGNIFTDDFFTMWSDRRLSLFRSCELNSCRMNNCANYLFCTGGCPAHGLYHYGDADRTDIRCFWGSME
jgi:radical SAM protein with 4Fe4S-binding SPASM domain